MKSREDLEKEIERLRSDLDSAVDLWYEVVVERDALMISLSLVSVSGRRSLVEHEAACRKDRYRRRESK